MTTLKSKNKGHYFKRITGTNLLSIVLAFLLLIALLITLGPVRRMVDAHSWTQQQIPGPIRLQQQHQHNNAADTVQADVDVVELEHEEAFRATMTHCLPAENQKKCKQFMTIHNSSSKPTQRVAIIAPPGDVSRTLVQRVQAMAQQHNQLAQRNTDLEIIVRTHVPPYGYGKTHGLSNVIRIIPQPVLLQVTDALQSLLTHGETHAVITLQDVKAALRQILRFHCRISHLSAHTALLSVDMMTFELDDDELDSVLRSFLVPDDDPKEDTAEERNIVDDDFNELYKAHATHGTQTLTHVQQQHVKLNLLQILDQVLQNEMELSHNMTAWPCPSFWNVGDEPDSTRLSPLVQRLAQALSPDCDNDPYATCWVERDKCEAAGDAVCAKKKK